jgi:hypothetical protein
MNPNHIMASGSLCGRGHHARPHGEHPIRRPGSKLVRMNRCERSNAPFGLRITRFQDHPADLKLPAECDEWLSRPPACGDRRLPVPHQPPGQRPQSRQVARQAPQDVGRLLAEHPGAGDRARPAHLRGDHPATPSLPVANRDRLTGLPRSHWTSSPGR